MPQRPSFESFTRPVVQSRGMTCDLLAVVTLTLAASCGGDAAEPQLPAPGAVTSGSLSAAPTLSTAEPAAGSPGATTDPNAAAASTYVREEMNFADEVPADALAYFEFASLSALEEFSLRMTTVVGTDGIEVLDPGFALLPMAAAGVDLSLIDRDAVIALAYVPVPGELFPQAMVFAPALSEDSIVTSLAALSNRGMDLRRTSGGYAVIEPLGLAEPASRGGSELPLDLPETVIRGRFDTESFLPLLNPALEPLAHALNEAYRLARPKVSAGDLYEFTPKSFTAFVSKSEQLGFGLDLEGDRAVVTLEMAGVRSEAYENGPDQEELYATLNELSHHIDTEGPASFVTAFNGESAAKTLRSLWENRDSWSHVGRTRLFGASFDDGGRSKLSTATLDSMELAIERMLRSFQPGAGFSFQLEPAKAHVAIYLAAQQPERAREAISLLLSKCDLEGWGFEMALPIRSMMDGTLVEDYSVRFDTRRLDFDRRAAMRNAFKTYLGDSSLHLKVATSGRHVLVILGGDTMAVDERIADFSDRGLANAELVEAIDRVGTADAAMVWHADLVQVLGQISGLGAVAKGHSVADMHRELVREVGDHSAPFVFWSGPKGRDEVHGASFDLKSLATAFDAFKGSGL